MRVAFAVKPKLGLPVAAAASTASAPVVIRASSPTLALALELFERLIIVSRQLPPAPAHHRGLPFNKN